MAASPHLAARRIFKWAKGNAERTAGVIAAFDAAVTGMLTKGGMSTLSSSAKNAISITMTLGMPEADRQAALEIAKDALENGTFPSTRGRVGFL